MLISGDQSLRRGTVIIRKKKLVSLKKIALGALGGEEEDFN